VKYGKILRILKSKMGIKNQVDTSQAVLRPEKGTAVLQREQIEKKTKADEQKLLAEINKTQGVAKPNTEKLKSGEKITAKDFREAVAALGRGDFKKIISIFKKIFFGKGNHIEGLGLKLVDKLETNPEKAQVAARLRMINKPESWDDKIGSSHASFIHELSLHRAGYHPRETKTHRIIPMSAGQTIKEVVPGSVWTQIKNGDVLNALGYNKPLYGHAETQYYLHVDSEGFPIYLAGAEGGTHTALLFEKEKDEGKQAEMKKDSKLDVLKNKLEPGDIIWTYKKDSIILPQLIRAGQNPDFPFSHMLVYLGDGVVGQIHKDGGERFSLAEMVGSSRNYKTLCTGELVGEDKAELVAEANSWIDKTGDYAESVYFNMGNHTLRGKSLKERKLKKGDSAVCVDLLRAAKNPELRALLDSGETRPYEFFKLGVFRAKYSVSSIDD
jgi:hypothetical protein